MRPVMRRITSPTRKPKVLTWYPCPVPGCHQGSSAASAAVIAGQSSMLPGGSLRRTAGSPA